MGSGPERGNVSLGLRPAATAGGDDGNGGVSAGSHGAPYVTPVLMVLFDNGSVQCYTSPAHLAAVDKERNRAAAERVAATAATAAAAAVDAAAATTASSGQKYDARPLLSPSSPTTRGAQDAEEEEEGEVMINWRSKPATRAPRPVEWRARPARTAAAAAAAAAAASTSLMDAAGRMTLRSAAGESSTMSPAAASGGAAPDAQAGGTGAAPKASPSHRATARPRLWQPPAALASSPNTLEEALAARRAGKRAADRAQRMAWASYLAAGASSGGGRGDMDVQAAASALSGHSSVRGGTDGDSVERFAALVAGVAVPGGTAGVRAGGGGGSSSGHESTSEDEAFVSFRSQVRHYKRNESCYVGVLEVW